MAAPAGKRYIKTLKKKGRKIANLRKTDETISVPFPEVAIRLRDLKRVGVKMAVGLATLLGLPCVLDAEVRQHLLGEREPDNTVSMDFLVHGQLERARPPLSHAIYVEGNQRTHHSYAVVQFYGIIQFYVVLSEAGYLGQDFAAIGILDTAAGYKEIFRNSEILSLERPRPIVPPWEYSRLQRQWQEKCETETRAVFGSDKISMSVVVPPRFVPMRAPLWELRDGTQRMISFSKDPDTLKD